ncbi:MAG: cytochrome C oxidase subunit IV family protein [Acidobacteriia bacterium]|nr:cytochrome C oxidase subunit IV family protein [Terriglobia bacterium]
MNQHGEPSHHVDSVRTYVGVLIALLIATIVTALVATLDLGPFNIIVALGIACVKMMLVVLFFMHVRYSTLLTRLVMIGGLMWLAILLLLSFVDFGTRGWIGVPGK